MGNYSKGILGPFSGKVGTVIGSSWKGIDYMRSLPRKSKKAPSESQRDQRIKFSLISGFMRTVSSLVQQTFNDSGKSMSRYNTALQLNLKEAVTGTYPDFEIDFSKVLVSRGNLLNVSAAQVVAGPDNTIQWTWSDNSGAGQAAPTDKAILVAHCKELKQTIYEFGANRSEGEASLSVQAFAGQQVETWIGFISDNGKLVSDSRYTGQISFIL